MQLIDAIQNDRWKLLHFEIFNLKCCNSNSKLNDATLNEEFQNDATKMMQLKSLKTTEAKWNNWNKCM